MKFKITWIIVQCKIIDSVFKNGICRVYNHEISLLNYKRNIKYIIQIWNAMLIKVQFLGVLLEVFMYFKVNSSLKKTLHNAYIINNIHIKDISYSWAQFKEHWFNITFITDV